jgi:hypothetical protein
MMMMMDSELDPVSSVTRPLDVDDAGDRELVQGRSSREGQTLFISSISSREPWLELVLALVLGGESKAVFDGMTRPEMLIAAVVVAVGVGTGEMRVKVETRDRVKRLETVTVTTVGQGRVSIIVHGSQGRVNGLDTAVNLGAGPTLDSRA